VEKSENIVPMNCDKCYKFTITLNIIHNYSPTYLHWNQDGRSVLDAVEHTTCYPAPQQPSALHLACRNEPVIHPQIVTMMQYSGQAGAGNTLHEKCMAGGTIVMNYI